MRKRPQDDVRHTINLLLDRGLIDVGEYFGEMTPDFDKPAGAPCPHQRHNKGCAVYTKRPWGCRLWNCRWLVNNDTAELRRPDRSRYVVDLMPDYITAVDNATGERRDVEVVQIWVDPQDRDAWRRDKDLIAFLERRGKEGIAAIMRYSESDALVVFPPSMATDRQWHEHSGDAVGRSISDRAEGIARAQQQRGE
jgi:hypothetical protein